MPAVNLVFPDMTYMAVKPLQSPKAATLPFPKFPANACDIAVPDAGLPLYLFTMAVGESLKMFV